MTPYTTAAEALTVAHATAVRDQRPYAERAHLEHAAELCARLARETGETP